MSPSRTEPVWIIGPASDLAFVIGGALVAFGLLAAHVWFGVAAVTIYMAWVLTIDGPHVFATVSRTYLDRDERRAHGPLLVGSLAFFALGPAIVGLACLTDSRLPYDGFLAVCTAWAYWHVVRQHYGVMVLYQRSAGDADAADARYDVVALYVGLLAPVAAFALGNETTLRMVGIATPPAMAARTADALWILVGVTLAAYALRQVSHVGRGRGVRWTKVLFLIAATSVSIVLFAPPVAAHVQYEAIVPIVTSFHDVQYLAIVWFFHRNRRAAEPRGAQPPLVARWLWAFLAGGLLFTLAYRVGLGCLASAWPGCQVGAETVALPAGLTLSDLGVAFLWGFALHHYYLDQRIWHVRRDATLRARLRLDADSSKPASLAA
jgi:hypothetical protein